MSWLMIRRMMAGAFIICAATAPAGAQQATDWNRGAVLAQTWCAACHVVDHYGTGSSFATPPSFVDLARDPKITPGIIRQTISVSHTLMPKMALSERDKNDLIAYILSLRYAPD